jgi:hypothetical protein
LLLNPAQSCSILHCCHSTATTTGPCLFLFPLLLRALRPPLLLLLGCCRQGVSQVVHDSLKAGQQQDTQQTTPSTVGKSQSVSSQSHCQAAATRGLTTGHAAADVLSTAN